MSAKEAAEAEYWLDLFIESGIGSKERGTQRASKESDELLRILIASAKTAGAKARLEIKSRSRKTDAPPPHQTKITRSAGFQSAISNQQSVISDIPLGFQSAISNQQSSYSSVGSQSAISNQRSKIVIDLHFHCLPFIDDGPGSWDDAVALCRMAAEEGVETIVATPHVLRDPWINHDQTERDDLLLRLNDLVGGTPAILAGCELYQSIFSASKRIFKICALE